MSAESDRHPFQRQHAVAEPDDTRFRPKIIGGMLALESTAAVTQTPPPFAANRSLLLATARGAVRLLCDILRPPRVWLPSYLCDVVIAPIAESGCDVVFYRIDAELRADDPDTLGDVGPGDIVVFIDYFGFSECESVGALARARGAWVVEDACQALFKTAMSHTADYALMSPRKFLGVPDGGILLARAGVPFVSDHLPGADTTWWLKAFDASRRRAMFDIAGGERDWFRAYQEVEASAPSAPCRMSELSRLILDCCVPWTHVARQRRENYAVLAAELGEFAWRDTLPDGCVPVGFPLRVANRDDVRSHLFAHDIFPPVHWPLHQVPAEFNDSHVVSAQLMTLPCDQRYDTEDMRRMAASFRLAEPRPITRQL